MIDTAPNMYASNTIGQMKTDLFIPLQSFSVLKSEFTLESVSVSGHPAVYTGMLQLVTIFFRKKWTVRKPVTGLS
jgi:hypothetical protein